MIEFKGKINGRALKFQAKRYRKMFILSCFAAAVPMLLLHGWLYLSLIVIFSVLCIGLPLFFILIPTRFWGMLAPKRVYIDLEDRTIVSEITGPREVFRMIDDIVEVKDYGEFYTFKFTSLKEYIHFVVQKDLITQGTIEEFEEIFEEVLVRK